MFDKHIDKFIEDLARHPLTPNVNNPWDYSVSTNEIRRNNLRGYFHKMYELKPTVMMVGEAPGYRGCGRVGMPFSSERLVLNQPFFADDRFSIENVESPMAETSATIVWKTFDALNFYPLMWSSFPYHPHKPDDKFSNRTPKSEEVQLGRQFVTRLVDIFSIEKIVAVGRIAEGTLKELGIEAPGIRHPAHGGAVLFADGLANFKKNMTE